MPTEQGSLTDDELVEIMCEAADPVWNFHTDGRRAVVRRRTAAALSRIRRPLEARGIEIAAQYCETRMRIPAGDVSDELITLARQHAAGEDQS